MSIAKFSVRNPVLVNMIMIAVTVLGTYSLMTLPRELTPDVSFPWIFIWTNAPGLSPQDTERLITDQVEKEVRDVEGVDLITSISRENASFVWLRFETMSDDQFDKRMQEVRTEVEKVKLPAAAEAPLVLDFSIQDHLPMVSVVLSGNIPEKKLKDISEDLRDEILELRHVAKCQIAGIRERQIWVEVDPKKLQSYDIAISQVIEAIRAKNLDLSAGDIKVGRWEYLVRTVGEIERIDAINKVIVRASPIGHHLRVEDVARVRDTFRDPEVISRFNGAPSVTLTVSKKREGNSIELIDRIKTIVQKNEQRLPAEAEIAIINDSSVQIRQFLGILQNNAVLGMVLVVVCLYVFLGLRNALFAALGIPVTFMFTFLFMQYTGINLSGSSLFALVLVLGMIVDDAIVILENCYRFIQDGYSPREAAVLGTKQVAMPVFSSSLTTIAAFLPLMLMEGVIGQFLKVVPIVVSLALAASLFEAFFILPSHIAEWSRQRVRKRREGYISFTRLRRHYLSYLVRFLRRRYLVLAVCTGFLVLSVPLVWVVGIDMFASEEIPRVFVFVDLAVGTRLEITDEVLDKVEKIVRQLPESELVNTVTNTGLQQRDEQWFFKPSVGQVVMELSNKNRRRRSTDEIIADLRPRIKAVPGIKALEFKIFSNGPPVGAPVEVRVRGPYLEELQKVAELIKQELKSMPGVYDVNDDFLAGKRELRIRVDEEKAALLGLTVAQIAGSVYHAFEGGEATEIHDGDEEVSVIVKYSVDSRANLTDLQNMKIVTPLGANVSLKDVAHLDVEQGYSTIKHDELKRSISIKANVRTSETSALKVNRALEERFADISRRYPGYDLVFRGEFEEFKDAFGQLGQLFVLGLLLMYIILCGQFKSFFQPLIIFMAILFSFWGATFGLLFIGSPFNINNLYGLVALAGVAVNDSLVLISFINHAREGGVRRWRSILLAGKLRLRPILLTTVTTVTGLLPMAIGIGGKSDIWSPLANVMVWGLSVGTLLTLFLVPCLYAVLGDVKKAVLGGRFMDESGRLSKRLRYVFDFMSESNGNRGRKRRSVFKD